MKSIKFSESIEIKGSAELIFDYTQDYKNRLVWDTFLTEAYLLNNATKADKGVKAWCVAKNGLGMETEYVSFNRPKVTAIKMTKGPYMFKDFSASWTFTDNKNEMTTVTFLYSFRLRFPYNTFRVLVKSILRRNVRQRLRDLKSKVEENANQLMGII
ncbi:MAG TPA: SRPBCC family protein [Chryseolinea sp.]|nr:SRPBCC family protein [Chryseolinea sp.]HPM29372.1 SRPBCC family protein [Chryseolinea sp.]